MSDSLEVNPSCHLMRLSWPWLQYSADCECIYIPSWVQKHWLAAAVCCVTAVSACHHGSFSSLFLLHVRPPPSTPLTNTCSLINPITTSLCTQSGSRVSVHLCVCVHIQASVCLLLHVVNITAVLVSVTLMFFISSILAGVYFLMCSTQWVSFTHQTNKLKVQTVIKVKVSDLLPTCQKQAERTSGRLQLHSNEQTSDH